MAEFAGCSQPPATVLDVGCGVGGTSRMLARRWPEAKVTGVTLSKGQVERGMQLTREQGITNCELKVRFWDIGAGAGWHWVLMVCFLGCSSARAS